MKKLLIFTSLLMLVSCTYEVHPTQLVERQGQMYEINSTNPFTGSSVINHYNGQLAERKNQKDGKLEGLSESYYENGQLMESNNYKNGKPEDGPEYTYMSSGKLLMSQNYKNGKKHGLFLRYTRMNNGDHELKQSNLSAIDKYLNTSFSTPK